jgi:hypothetical protein
MPSASWLKLAGALLALLLGVAFVYAWLADRRDRDRLNAELATTKQLLFTANDRQHDRDAQLNQTLAALASEKRAVHTPTQIIRDLPRELPLPSPIALQPSLATNKNSSVSSVAAQSSAANTPPASNTKPAVPQAIVPAEDLKPLYDFALDCKACQARLAAAQSDLADEKSKTAALTKERDQALQIARGGSVLRRLRRAAKWFLIGAAAGAVAAKTAH